MTAPLTLLDDTPDVEDPAARGRWLADVGRTLEADSAEWVEAARSDGLTRDRAWALLSWAEHAATGVAAEGSAGLLRTTAFAFSLLEASPLDRRDVMVVAALLRRGAARAGLDFPEGVREGCARAGELGERCLEWLWWASEELPATHEEIGEGRSFEFRRKPADIDIDRLQQWLKGGQ